MKLVPRLVWSAATAPPSPLPEGLVPLLEAIGRTGSLLHAVAQCGISYRTGWALLQEARDQLGVPLVVLARGRGHGSVLTPAGRRLVDAATAASRRVARLSPSLAIELGERAPRLRRVAAERVRIAASHDLALAALRDAAAASGLELDLNFIGSLTALARRSRALPALPLRAARSPAALRRSRAGIDLAARQSVSGAEPARRCNARVALRQPPARLRDARADRAPA